MGTDIVNLCLMGIIALAGFALASRQMGRGRGYPRGGTPQSSPRGGSPRGERPNTGSGSYPGGRQAGELFPERGDSTSPSRPADSLSSSPAKPQSGGSVFPQAGDAPRRGGGFENGSDNGYGGREGGKLFPPKDDR